MSSLGEPGLVFSRRPEDQAGLQIWINFGILAGRSATPAEIDRLAHTILYTVPNVTIVSEVRYEIGVHTEASVHQLRIEIPPNLLPNQASDRLILEEQLTADAHAWATACTEERGTAGVDA